jgi:DNA polymerase III epsilon subunit-like protein
MPRRFLLIDCETCGLPISKSRSVPSKQVSNWPHCVQIAFMCVELSQDGMKTTLEEEYIIKPRGYTISEESTSIHKISHKYATENGIDICDALKHLENAMTQSDYIVCHNVDFDLKVLEASYYRCKKPNSKLFKMKRICTMKDKNIINYCAIPFATPSKFPNRREFKWPRLSELYNKCFNCDFPNAHNALADVRATRDVFEFLIDNDILKLTQ